MALTEVSLSDKIDVYPQYHKPDPREKQNNVFLISIFFILKLLVSFNAYLLFNFSLYFGGRW